MKNYYMKLHKIHLRKNREQSVKRYHPWIFSGAIQQIPNEAIEGDLVEVYDAEGNFLAIGHFQPESISIRILSFEKKTIDVHFFEERFRSCLNYRKQLLDTHTTNAYRLVHGEGDGLPGLIVDYYNGHLVVQCHSAGMFRMIEDITEALLNVFKSDVKTIYNKSFLSLPPKYLGRKPDAFLYGNCKSPVEILEHNHRFVVDFVEGQKTGFFIDQRENRKLLASLSCGKTVANLFGYTGGFSVYAAKAGAVEVITIDSSAKALQQAQQNYTLNQLVNIKNIKQDVMNFFKSNKKLFDIVILDPPAFAKNHKHKANALIAYKQINAKALKIIRQGGLLFSFSCSQAVTANDLRQAIFVAAASENKKIRVVYQLHQPPDHPVSIFHPEGEYLKGFVFQVESF